MIKVGVEIKFPLQLQLKCVVFNFTIKTNKWITLYLHKTAKECMKYFLFSIKNEFLLKTQKLNAAEYLALQSENADE